MNKLNFVMAYAMATLVAPKREEKGATIVEYALVIGLISLVLLVSWAALGPKISSMVDGINFGGSAPAAT